MADPPHPLSEFDPYRYISPPLPLLDPSQFDDFSLSPKAKYSRSPHRIRVPSLTKGKGRRNRPSGREEVEKEQDKSVISLFQTENPSVFCTENSFKSDLPETIAEPCICDSQSPVYQQVKATFPAFPPPIPLLSREFTDHLFDVGKAYSKYPCIYHRQRLPDFAQHLESLLDASLPIYRAGKDEEVVDCPKHRKYRQRRLKGVAQGLSHSELVFDAGFEGGNLDRVVMVGVDEFHLFVSPDSNTQGYTQWFYFSVRNKHCGHAVSISIVNFTKSGSPFGRGMKPSVFSLVRSKVYGTGWTRGGYDVRYLKNTLPRGSKGIATYYTLAFSYAFQFDDDTVYFAYSEPYTYSRLQHFLTEIRENLPRDVRLEERVLARTIGGFVCPQLLISDFSFINNKKKVSVTARVHPGETVSSFIMEGFLRFIVSTHPVAVYLRRACEFHVVPMLNPDGVVMGNTRTGLAGRDLNRKWDQPDEVLHPVITAAKEALSGSVCFIDLHGHSKKDYCFMYGNSFSRQDERFWASRFLPICMAKLTPCFNYSFCYFFNSQSHDKAARTVMFNEKKVLHSFTLEASFNGIGSGEKKIEFDSAVLREIGWKLAEAIYGLVAYLLKKTGKEVSTQEGVYSLAKQLLSRLSQARMKPLLKPLTSAVTVQGQEEDREDQVEEETKETQEIEEDRGSDSEPECDELPVTEFVSLEQAITTTLKNCPRTSALNQQDLSPPRRLYKASSKLLFKDPVERIQLKFMGPSDSQTPAMHRHVTGNEGGSMGESRGSLVPMRRYTQALNAVRRKSHSPGETMRVPKDVGLEGYLQLVREVRRKLVSRIPAL